MVWAYSGNVYQSGANGQTAEAFGFEYSRVGSNPRFQGRVGNTKMRIGLCGDMCKLYTSADANTADVQYIRIASISTKMIPAAIRLFTSFDFSAPTDNRYSLGLAYPATLKQKNADSGKLVGYSASNIEDLFQKYFGRLNADGSTVSDTTKTTKSKDEERMLTTWPAITSPTTQADYEDWTLSRYNRSIEKIWAMPEIQDVISGEASTLPAYLDIVFRNYRLLPAWTTTSFMQFNCTFAVG